MTEQLDGSRAPSAPTSPSHASAPTSPSHASDPTSPALAPSDPTSPALAPSDPTTRRERAGAAADLQTFFEHAGRFLVRGEGSAEAVEAALGPSPSGTARLALYATLVERQQLEALEALFPSTRRALEACERGSFRRLGTHFARSHRSTSAHPGGLGPAFVAFVGRAELAPWVVELADSERARYELATSPEPIPARGFDPVHALRRYTHDVHRVTEAMPVPKPRGVSLLYARDPETLRVRWLELGPAELVAIGIATGTFEADEAQSLGLDLDRARARLRSFGWAPDRG